MSQLVTRRTSQRQYYLCPRKSTNGVIKYCLGAALERFPGILLTSFCFLSNHYHFYLTDLSGEMPAFLHLLNTLIARAMNVKLGRRENFWCPGSYSSVELYGEDTRWAKLLYVVSQPVKDGLVARLEDWPGLLSLPEDVGTRTFRARKPAAFFRHGESSSLPDEVSFTLHAPPDLLDPTAPDEATALEKFREEFRRRLDAHLEDLHAIRVAAGRTQYLGRQAVLDQHPFDSPTSSFSASELNPKIACSDSERRNELLMGLAYWHQAYEAAISRWRFGDRDARFPHGTYWARVYLFVTCAPP